MEGPVRFKYMGTALPSVNGTTYPLFSTVTAFPMANGFQSMGFNRLELTIYNDQSGTIKAYQSPDRGITWIQVQADQAVSAANKENFFDWLVESYADFKVDWVQGATPQMAFSPNFAAVLGERNVAT